MRSNYLRFQFSIVFRAVIVILCFTAYTGLQAEFAWAAGETPSPLLEKGHPVDWWFVFKFNSKSFPGCGDNEQRQCLFGGDIQPYKHFSQQYVYASKANASLKKGGGCAGDTTTDPLGATFDEIYNGDLFYVIWNDQFYDDPVIKGCKGYCDGPWGHSKGALAWNTAGEGFVLQVTTPSWPASGSKGIPRKSDGNTLGCVKDDNVKVSQHFFSLKLTKGDVVEVLKALQNASVVTDPKNPQIVHNGGPADIQSLVKSLGKKSHSKTVIKAQLSSGVELISKPSELPVPPWQMVSAELGGAHLKVATWWASPKIYSTTAKTKIACWDDSIGKPGPVEIAESGQWDGKTFGLKGANGLDYNHAKIGVSTAGANHFAIFGDMNQQGTLSGPDCTVHQNGRGGLFYVIDNKVLSDGIANLIKGETAPVNAP